VFLFFPPLLLDVGLLTSDLAGKGDGVADVAVSARNDDASGTPRGAFFVLFLQANGRVGSFTKIRDDGLNGFAPGSLEDDAEFGQSLAALGDVVCWLGRSRLFSLSPPLLLSFPPAHPF
jgi:hypothetical protein